MERHFEDVVRKLKLKVTPRRLAILDVMASEAVFLSAEQIWTKVRGRVSRLGLPTVYRIVEEFVRAGMVSRVIHDDRQLYYYYCGNEAHHHHFVCLSCHRVEDIDLCLSENLRKEVSERIRGTLFSHILQLQGLCRRCAEQGQRAI
jgi:Fur family transcriptional regulator, ferric uptake regulator